MELYCPICDKEYPLETDALFCPESGKNGAHPLVKRDNTSELARVFPTTLTKRWNDNKLSFSVFREFMASYQLANAHGKATWWVERVLALSNACERLTGRGFVRTPEIAADDLAQAIDLPKASLFVKNETLQLTGSHKSRHLAGTIMHLETLRELSDDPDEKKTLAVCAGDDAMTAAAAVAAAAGYRLYAFVPENARESVVSALTNFGATVVMVAGEAAACRARYEDALKKFGWVPFSAYGRDVWSAVEGAETLEYEFLFNQYMIDAPLDVQVIQVAGGGLANAVSTANALFKRLDVIRKLPRLYTCQTAECYPLAQSYFLVLRELGRDGVVTLPPELAMLLEGDFDAKALLENNLGQIKMTAGLIAEMAPKIQDDLDAVFVKVGENRDDYFKPRADAPDACAATPYDGLEVVRGMILSGGLPLIVDADELAKANELAREHANIDASLTGSAGLAGLRRLIKSKLVQQGERCGILFTGARESKCDLPAIPDRIVTLTAEDDLSKLAD